MSKLIYEWIVLGKFADEICNRVSHRVIRHLRTNLATLSGDDSPLKNAWEEICVQVQFEQSIYWNVYVETIDLEIEGEMEQLQEHELAAIWFQTSEGEDWGFTDGDDRVEPHIDRQAVAAVIRDHVLSEANSYTNLRIRKYIDRFE
jgi:hypothetical protein